MKEIFEKIGELGLVPVVKIEQAGQALSLGRALIDGDLPVAEITFRTEAAEEAINTLSRELPELLVGAGTVLTVDQVEKAAAAGAKFIVSPGFNPRVVDYCVENNIPVTPGINSPSQVEMALERGLEVVKFFPAEASGGLPLLKAMSAPYGNMKFIPTGGINQDNLNVYLAFDRVHACGGSWMVKAELISSGRFEEITRLTRKAVAAMLGFELAHLGIPEESDERALESARMLAGLFYFTLKERDGSVSAGSAFEITGSRTQGRHGHIAISTHNLERAVSFLKRKKVFILPGTAEKRMAG